MSSTQKSRIATDLIWNRLIAILEDQAQNLIRTAFSTTTRESGDLSAGFFDREGRMIAQALTGTPGHVNSMARAVVHFLDAYPLATLAQGDVLLSNDPWLCSGHLHDFTLVTPVFHCGTAIGLVANTIHVVDIGGSGFGAGAGDVFEEGLCLPPLKIARAGEIDASVTQIIAANVRDAAQVLGDLHSSLLSNERAGERIGALLDEFAIRDVQEVAESIIARTQATVEARIAALPDGVYENSLELDSDSGMERVRLKLKLIVDGSRIILDFGGTSAMQPRGVNVVMNYTSAYAAFGINCLLNADIPCNHGSLQPIEVRAPAGSILNATRPAAVSARHMIGHLLPDLVFGALSQLLPVPAEGAGLIWNPSIRGTDATGRRFTIVAFHAGGAGALPHRDGWSATAFPSGVRAAPVEALEAAVPILVRRKELRADSGGAGEFRGGLGQVMEIAGDGDMPLNVNAMFDRTDSPPRGRGGGGDGACGVASLRSGAPFASKGPQVMASGDTLILQLPGGAGWGNPSTRQRDAVAEDVRQGYVSPAAAAALYGYSDDS
ncbi:MAG: hydantoinase B/oxoprolinase family protein [Sphingopyxis sp.]|nr:hydantoinase B/oxoprolinase family protein [Sphingopyxis sp.]